MKEPSGRTRRYEPLPESFRLARAKIQGILVGAGIAALATAVHSGITGMLGAAVFFGLAGVVAGVVAFSLVPLMTRGLDK